MARKRKPKSSEDAPAVEDTPEDHDPRPLPLPPEPPPAPGAGSWIILAIHKTRMGHSHRILSRDWKVIPPEDANNPEAMRFESQHDANAFINGELATYGGGRPLCVYRFTPLNIED